MSTCGRVVVVILVLGLPVICVAQPADVEPDVAVTQSSAIEGVEPIAEPDGRTRWHLELTGGFFLEAWDLNQFRDQLLGGTFGFSRRVAPHWTIGVETSLLRVSRQPVGGLLMPAVSVVLRRTVFQVGETVVFLEGGGGGSYASDEVPDSGTRFNLVAQTGVGLTRAMSRRIDVVGGLRWLHVSNNSLNGRARNPDIQALGLYFGWRVK